MGCQLLTRTFSLGEAQSTRTAKFDPTSGSTSVPTSVPMSGPTKVPTRVSTRVPTNVRFPAWALRGLPTKGPTKRPTRVSTEVPTKVSTEAVSFHMFCFHMFCSLPIHVEIAVRYPPPLLWHEYYSNSVLTTWGFLWDCLSSTFWVYLSSRFRFWELKWTFKSKIWA